ncbi:LOW QUALITY PROTEIN: uncharacterized protein LOC110225728 [Arabidopsis lyrata subsp. lyrata]|uniref:LOW QUALITY PROTEIN: uncharacterized protein LOC110225728 n=1 Tax=Arabidopsis lyrata subsp. lyrata TaxID=81972 RepID=UPI000A29D8B7|nr:LOW QUALITY PROTEIN: uncharacterized protein LOC110225728 [Arabidopsis lyrata subsp. lyrata]|eukprot:XP_020871350.1 LOW QUALITY PROTEIN: uncharacterized protein LOC110225728 [Arabidopsis lyrata subsp. lyrata]
MLLEISIAVQLHCSSVHSIFHSIKLSRNYNTRLSFDEPGKTGVDVQSHLPFDEKKVQKNMFCLMLLRLSTAHKKLNKSA